MPGIWDDILGSVDREAKQARREDMMLTEERNGVSTVREEDLIGGRTPLMDTDEELY